jgi:L-iditol 2-dehydrogenase
MFEIRDIPDPVAPHDGLVLQVRACGVCGSDLRRWKEGPPENVDHIVPGHEVAGVVVEVGKNITQISCGDRLAVAPDIHCGKCYYCQHELYNLCDDLRLVGITPGYPGGFADKMVLSREILANGIVNPIPERLAFTNAALAEPLCSVLASHQKAGIDGNSVIVIMGAGPIGCLHIVAAKAKGAKVIISEPSEVRCNMVQRFVPDEIVNPIDEDLAARVRVSTNNVGPDVVICANPVADTQTTAVQIVRKRGKVILFGGLPKNNPMTTLNANIIHYAEIEVIGSFSYHPHIHKQALDMLDRNLIPAEHLITHEFPLNEIGRAYQTAANSNALKVVITI